MGVKSRAVDQQCLGRAANPGAAQCRVHRNPDRHVEIGVGMDIDMADALKMRKDRHTRFALHTTDKALTAARYDHIDRPGKAGQHQPNRVAIPRRHKLDGILRQSSHRKSGTHRVSNGGGRPKTFRTRAQNRRIAAFEAQRSGVRRDIGAAFENHANDAKRRRHPLKAQAIRARPFREHPADRIMKRRDILNRPRNRLDPLVIERQAVKKRALRAPRGSIGEIRRIRYEHVGPCRPKGRCGRQKRVVFLRCRCIGKS